VGTRRNEEREASADMDEHQDRMIRHAASALLPLPAVVNFTVGMHLGTAKPHATDDGLSRPNGGRLGRTERNVRTLRAAALAAWVALGAFPGFTQASDWEVIAEKDGIIVSRRAVEGRSFPQLRAVGEVQGAPYEVLAVLLDVPAHVRWLPDCVQSRSLRRLDAWRNVVYSRTDAPWPVSDREAILENEVIFLDPPWKLKVTFEAIAAPDVARARGTVRMTSVNGFYLIEAIDGRRSRVHYEIDADPAGTLPAWLIAMQSTRNPDQTVAGLRRRLNETRGQYDAQIAGFPR
jgi:hypothetical protein